MPHRIAARPALYRPRLEVLEARTLLNNRFVLPLGVPVDNTTTFTTLQAALATAGLTAGDTIQIEPGSAPGNVTAMAPPVASLTIQGDPNAPPGAIPLFTISGPFTAVPGLGRFTLKNVNAGLVDSGALTIQANFTLTNSVLVDINSTSTLPITLSGGANVVTGSTVVNDVTVSNGMLTVETPAGGSSNLFSGDTFVVNAFSNDEFGYADGSAATVTDQVIGNTFLVSPGASANSLLTVEESLTNLTIADNTFSGPGSTGIYQVPFFYPQNLQIVGNTLRLTAASAIDIDLQGGGPNSSVSAVVANNQISTNGTNGYGLRFDLSAAATGALNVKVQGNDFHDNAFGIEIGGATGPAGGIDLGGGNQGSLGDNDFRGFTVPNMPSNVAIQVAGVALSQGTVRAQHNAFAGSVTPASVVSDPNHNLNLANPLSANAAFVAALYNDFLKRAGDTTNANDAGGWVTALNGNTMTPAQVAAAISKTPEALGVVVDGLYQKLLNRAADPNGRAELVTYLSNGGTLEQVVDSLVTSAEYAADTGGTDFGFVESLYVKLLGRTGSNAEVAYFLSQLPGGGRAGVANVILYSAEFRGDAAQQFYGFATPPAMSLLSALPPLLHRTTAPSAGDITSWVNSGLAVLSMASVFAETQEFFTNG